jgi:hypothetical protein
MFRTLSKQGKVRLRLARELHGLASLLAVFKLYRIDRTIIDTQPTVCYTAKTTALPEINLPAQSESRLTLVVCHERPMKPVSNRLEFLAWGLDSQALLRRRMERRMASCDVVVS